MLMTSCFNARLPSEVCKNAIISKFVETKGIEVVRAANALFRVIPSLYTYEPQFSISYFFFDERDSYFLYVYSLLVSCMTLAYLKIKGAAFNGQKCQFCFNDPVSVY